jgi:hypothetical protein
LVAGRGGVTDYPVLAVVQLLETARRIYSARELKALDLGLLEAHCIVELERRLAAPAGRKLGSRGCAGAIRSLDNAGRARVPAYRRNRADVHIALTLPMW